MGQKCHFWVDPPTLNLTWQPNKLIFKKATLSDSGLINSARNGENRIKIDQAMPEKRWRVCTHSQTCARRSPFTGDFSKTAEQISTKIFRQTADVIWGGIENVWFKRLKLVGVSGWGMSLFGRLPN